MNPTQTTFEMEGVTYTFRLPSATDMIEVDIDALNKRGGITQGLNMAYTYSQNIALLSKLCVSPTGIDFASQPMYVVEQLGVKLANWLNTFSKPVEQKPDAVGTGSSQ